MKDLIGENVSLDQKDNDEITALGKAAFSGRCDIFELLINAGADFSV